MNCGSVAILNITRKSIVRDYSSKDTNYYNRYRFVDFIKLHEGKNAIRNWFGMH